MWCIAECRRTEKTTETARQPHITLAFNLCYQCVLFYTHHNHNEQQTNTRVHLLNNCQISISNRGSKSKSWTLSNTKHSLMYLCIHIFSLICGHTNTTMLLLTNDRRNEEKNNNASINTNTLEHQFDISNAQRERERANLQPKYTRIWIIRMYCNSFSIFSFLIRLRTHIFRDLYLAIWQRVRVKKREREGRHIFV